MHDAAVPLPCPAYATPLALASALAALLLGAAALPLGLAQESAALGGFGVAALLQVGPALALWGRIRGGLGNRGLEREVRTLKAASLALRLAALVLAAVAGVALAGRHDPLPSLASPGFALAAALLLAGLAWARQPLAELHPSLALDAARGRALLEAAGILLAGTLVARLWPPGDPLAALGLALRLHFHGRSLSAFSAYQASCGGCGGGCGC